MLLIPLLALPFLLAPTRGCAPTAIQPIPPLIVVPTQNADPYPTTHSPTPSTTSNPVTTPSTTPNPVTTPSTTPAGKRRRRHNLAAKWTTLQVRFETTFPFQAKPAQNQANLLKLLTQLRPVFPASSLPTSLGPLAISYESTADGRLVVVVNGKRADSAKCGLLPELAAKAVRAAPASLKAVQINCDAVDTKVPTRR